MSSIRSGWKPGVALSLIAAFATFLLGGPLRTAAQTSAKPAAAPRSGGTTGLQTGPVTLSPKSLLPAVLTYQLWHGIPILDQIVNDRALEKFVLATGLNANTISPAAVTRLVLGTPGAQVHVTLLDSTRDAGQVPIESLKIGMLIVENTPFAVLDMAETISRIPHPDAPTGWLGSPYFSAFQVTFDPVTRTVILDAPKPGLPTQKNLPPVKGAVTVPLVMREGRPYVQVTVPGAKPFLALVDTGSAGTMVPAGVVAKMISKQDKGMPLSLPDGKEGQANMVTLAALRVGKAEWKAARVLTVVPTPNSTLDPDLAVLGMDFLSRFKMILNIPFQKLTLAPLTLPKAVGEPGTEASGGLGQK